MLSYTFQVRVVEMKGGVNLLGLRMLSVMIAVITNVLMVKLLSLDEVGRYYILLAIAYFGNALFFVGFDFSLQRKIQNIYIDKCLNFKSLKLYLLRVIPCGALASFCLSLAVSFVGGAEYWIEVALLCSVLAVTNFLTSIFRNILQIAGEKYRVSHSVLLEQVSKLCLSFSLVMFFGATAYIVVFSFVLSGVLCFLFNLHQLFRCINSNSENKSYALDSDDISKIVLPVSAGGVLNWMQLQAYRPVLGQFMQQTELVGVVSFLTMLGSTVTSALLGVLAQVWTPKQFATKGGDSRRFVLLSSIVILVLALLAYPVAYVFLRLLGKENLYGVEYLVSIGVIVEGCNFILGVLGNHSSLTKGSFVPSMFSGVFGFLMVAAIIFSLITYQVIGPGTIGLALALSQCAAVAALLPVLLKSHKG